MLEKNDVLGMIKDLSGAGVIDKNAYDAITWNMAYGEKRYLNRYCNAETATMFLQMIKADFPRR